MSLSQSLHSTNGEGHHLWMVWGFTMMGKTGAGVAWDREIEHCDSCILNVGSFLCI